MSSLRDKIFEAAEYEKNGDPMKDVMDEYNFIDAVLWLRKFLIMHPEELESPFEKDLQGDDEDEIELV